MNLRGSLAAAGLVVLAACGADPSAPADSDGLVHGVGTVLEDDSHGPELCFAVADSYPPQCDGVPLEGFEWPDDAESASGARFGDYGVEGRYVDGVLQVERVAAPPDEPADPFDVDGAMFATPCPEPEGGWKPVDPERATDEAMEAFFTTAEGLPGYAEAWIDDQGAPTRDDGTQDPGAAVLNVRVTEDVAGAERALRGVWGGAMCVSEADRTEAELLEIQAAVEDLPGMITAGVMSGVVYLTVLYDDGTLQDQVDAEHGAGVVRVTSALQPGPLPG